MKKSLQLMGLLLFSFCAVHARFDTISGSAEFKRRVDNFDFALVAFADASSFPGSKIPDAMRDLARKDRFKDDLDGRVGFLFVPMNKKSNHDLGHQYGYQGKPMFILFEGDDKIADKRLTTDHIATQLQNFIESKVSHGLDEIAEDVRDERNASDRREFYKSKPRFHIGFNTGYYPGYGYYRHGRPGWWHRRYRRGYGPYSRRYYRRPEFPFGFGV